MQPSFHPMKELFEQLGLDSSEAAIEAFIARNRPIPGNVPLAEADCWTDSQRHFLEEALADDADWAEAVDHLDARMR